MNKTFIHTVITTFVLPLALMSFTSSCEDFEDNGGTASSTPAATSPAFNDPMVKGADISWLTEMESNGKVFKDTAGNEADCLSVLKSIGTNTIRLRVWVNPADGWCDITDLLEKAARANRMGFRLMIDFHYSDSWADPGKQTIPAEWQADATDMDKMVQHVKEHTTEVLTALKEWAITPEWVQVGNETGTGMLWVSSDDHRSTADFVKLLNAGYDAAKAVFPNVKVVNHVQNGWYTNYVVNYCTGLKNNGAKYDVLGVSLYPIGAMENSKCSATTDKGVVDMCITTLNKVITTFDKDVLVAEFGYPSSEVASGEKCLSYLFEQLNTISRCEGVMYWEPEAFANWKSYGMDAFNNDGSPSDILNPFKAVYR